MVPSTSALTPRAAGPTPLPTLAENQKRPSESAPSAATCATSDSAQETAGFARVVSELPSPHFGWKLLRANFNEDELAASWSEVMTSARDAAAAARAAAAAAAKRPPLPPPKLSALPASLSPPKGVPLTHAVPAADESTDVSHWKWAFKALEQRNRELLSENTALHAKNKELEKQSSLVQAALNAAVEAKLPAQLIGGAPSPRGPSVAFLTDGAIPGAESPRVVIVVGGGGSGSGSFATPASRAALAGRALPALPEPGSGSRAAGYAARHAGQKDSPPPPPSQKKPEEGVASRVRYGGRAREDKGGGGGGFPPLPTPGRGRRGAPEPVGPSKDARARAYAAKQREILRWRAERHARVQLDKEGDEADDAAHQADDEAGSPSPKLISVPRRRQQPRPLQAATGAQPGESQAPAPPPPPAPRSDAPARRYIPPPEGRKPKPKPVAAPEPADTFVDDSTLSFDEFTALVATLEPKRDFSDADLSRRFDELKPSADGRVFAQDVRLTLLWEALSRKAGRVIDLFRKWDHDGSGSVDVGEFGRALSQLGFAFSSRDSAFIFEHLDVDGSGTVDYNELNSRLRPKTMARQLYKLRTDASLKRGAARMNLQGGKQTLDLSPGAPPVQEQIKVIIMANRLRILDTFRMWDVDGDGAISCEEFADAFAALGYEAARADLDAVFDRFDQDGSGRVDYLEMSAQLRPGKRHHHAPRIAPRPPAVTPATAPATAPAAAPAAAPDAAPAAAPAAGAVAGGSSTSPQEAASAEQASTKAAATDGLSAVDAAAEAPPEAAEAMLE